MRRRNHEDLRNPERIFYQMIQDYSSGRLHNEAPWVRARVEAIDVEGGKLEASPPNPINSIRARVYTSGLDATTPTAMLPIFYPLLPPGAAPSVLPGEHVLVQFEDSNKTSGYWITTIPSFNQPQLNYSNPDFRSLGEPDSSYSFEGDEPPTTTVNTDLEYGGSTTNSTGRQSMIDEAESTTPETNPWAGKRVLLLGDSQVAGPWGTKLGEILRGNHGVSFFAKEGRVSWGVISWLNRRLRPDSPLMPSLQDVINQHRPDIVIISLGGNDGSSGRARRSDYSQKVQQLYDIVRDRVETIIWSGPPTAVGRASDRQAARAIAAQKINTIVGAERFVDVSAVTNTTRGRRPDGVHFTSASPALEPWADLVVRKGYSLRNS